ncbi:MAG: gliding motility protein GldN [Prevotella sp.]|nr:gliding motility protein GldN [Prevotella sp.]
MRRLLTILFIACAAQGLMAQPAARRQQAAAAKANAATSLSTRAQISFPTQAPMDEDVVWRRDIYREIDITQDANAGLYYPVEPVGSQMNLFTYIFKLVMRRSVPAYEYRLDGNEVFDDASQVNLRSILDNYHIFYERTDKGIRIDDSDIPSKEVTAYYVKESSYFDQNSATFHTKVLALCPILKREDDFGDGTTNYPLFWIKYDDLAPYLSKQTIMTSNLNNAAVMSMADFFTKNMYRGKIYKTNNMLGKSLAQYCPTDSAMAREQRRIEGELKAFEKNIWGDSARKDSLDSIARLDKKDLKATKRKNRRAGGASSASSVSKPRKTSGRSSASSGSAARVTVRRERH